MAAHSPQAAQARSPEDVLLDRGEESSRTLIVCSIFSDERPLKRIPGLLDWRLRGFISRFLVKGWITGKTNELVYIPVKHQGSMRHLLLVGLGTTGLAGKKTEHERSLFLNRFGDTVRKLGFRKIAISQSSFGFLEQDAFKKACSSNVEIEFTV